MQNLNIKKSKVTPHVNFQTNGKLLIEGVTLPEDASKFYSPLLKFIEHLETRNIHFTIKLEYINTASAKQIFHIFHLLENKQDLCSVKIDWVYADDDEDIHDSGLHFATLVPDLKFNFVEYADI